ncbi:c-type cytochrome [Hyphococcus sp.]|uniref:c-type cytochrome n=1 Tax=Hyphococcus sp. TaxID=2038636 RepID=UPI0035C7471A
MTVRAFVPFLACTVLALAGCGDKETSEPVAEPEEMSVVAETASTAETQAEPNNTSGDAHGAELTKVSSQAAAAEQAKGVFKRAAQGDPEAVYLANCQYCHIQLGPGTITLSRRLGPEEALLANRTDLTEGYVETVVRNGLNTMPALTRVEVSDEELELIAAYLTRNNNSGEE